MNTNKARITIDESTVKIALAALHRRIEETRLQLTIIRLEPHPNAELIDLVRDDLDRCMKAHNRLNRINFETKISSS